MTSGKKESKCRKNFLTYYSGGCLYALSLSQDITTTQPSPSRSFTSSSTAQFSTIPWIIHTTPLHNGTSTTGRGHSVGPFSASC